MNLPAAAAAPRAAIEGHFSVLAPNVYFDNHFDLEAAKILPGEYYVTQHDMVLVTVLGSCVTACIRDRLSGIGGMNHFMLPDARPDSDNPVSLSARYGAFAMEVLINSLICLGARRTLLEAKVFGGGNVLPGMTTMNIGQRNADFALGFLSTEKIRVVARDLIDVYPRKVYYFPKSGKVLVKKLRKVHNDTIYRREIEYGARLVKEEVAGDVELFG
ncbi:MAG: chemoreceptor glutamine deamidase CheD [Betaproteobacteria bacterium]|nr:chemoreceptor glutamine deamidase CheD [Betaproteobacteria bacterium]